MQTQKSHMAFLRTPTKCATMGRGQISDRIILQMSNKIDFKGRLAHPPGKLFMTDASQQPKDRDSVLEHKVKGQGPDLHMYSKMKIIQLDRSVIELNTKGCASRGKPSQS